MMDQPERDQSEFNDAISKLRRMDSCFNYCTIARYEKNADLWIQSLVSLFSELITAMNDDEIKKKSELKKIADQINQGFLTSNVAQSGGISREVYWQLLEFEMFLRKIYKASGYEGKKKDNFLDPENW